MKSILLAWIGNTDLRAAKENSPKDLGPIGQAVKERAFDQIELLSNYPKADNTLYEKWLRGRTAAPLRVRAVSLTRPTDFGEIHQAVVKLNQELRKAEAANHKYTYHISPGTPAMCAVWILLAKTRFPAELIESSREDGVRTAAIPFDISAEYIPDLMRRPDETLTELAAGQAQTAPEFAHIIHRSGSMRKVLDLAQRIALRKVPVLIEGESGTGKELLARAIHNASPRAQHPFIAVNCGAIPAELVESELFGHEKGAFTGAAQKRDGHFIKAHGGTLFLDEVGELPLPAQVKLLRVLQEQEVTPLGSSHARKIDVRVVSATNRNLIDEVARGTFREDLYYRLAVFSLHLPPLREREGDVGLLIDSLLERLNQENADSLGIEQKKLSAQARNLLLNHSWPGNVRALQNTLLRAAIIATKPNISEDDVRAALAPAISQAQDQVLNRPLNDQFNLPELLAAVVRHYLNRALQETNGNKSEAAKLVGLPSYQTLTNWLKKYEIEIGT
ncbi:MAG TPA: sigma-54 dependent transcriptional regulator [Blastocatellia bacterium]|nr:sigma-54 dependent transcriptional regulator [Blastocatellia bacterium]HMX26907.1 sigma-54 dependent transcriptional regulator [Blastocatellia bacterium]HMY70267.1 sigma-54 dependent transcriptional regulator [Blastocatellia bacterium]HMZ17549.1 sigma-54 dependent transcriptional regulator [Blastocatellia bacterium]